MAFTNCFICIVFKLSWVVPRAHDIFRLAYFQELSKKTPTILANIINICRVRFHVEFSSKEIIMGYSPKFPSSKPKAGTHDTLNQ